MSYLQFLLVFLLPPMAVMGIYIYCAQIHIKLKFLKAIGALCVLAFTYTTPWDNYLVANGIWDYGEDRVLGVIGHVPIEEYAFFFLQTIMTGQWAILLHTRLPFLSTPIGTRSRAPVIIGFILFEALSIAFLFFDPTKYLGLITCWSFPVIFLQLFFGQEIISKNWRYLAYCILPPTVFLWIADLYAIRDGIWTISESYTTGLGLFGLPVEEALFFMVTNVMVAQGLCLFVFAKEQAFQFLSKLLGPIRERV